MSNYVFGRTVPMSFDAASQRITEELAKVGFGVLTEIDVQATMKKKLGQENAALPHPWRMQPAVRQPGDRRRAPDRRAAAVQRGRGARMPPAACTSR